MSNPPFQQLHKKYRLLQKSNALIKLENSLLKKEISLLKKQLKILNKQTPNAEISQERLQKIKEVFDAALKPPIADKTQDEI